MHEKKNLVKNLETENFSISIGQVSIKYQSSQVDSNKKFKHNFNQSSNSFDRSKIWKNEFFEKQSKFIRNYSKHHISWMKCMSMSLKVFQKHLNSTQIFQNKIFNSFVLKTQTLNIFCIRIKEYLILDGHNKITHNKE